MKLADRRGNIEECSSGQDRLLEWIYTHETGRFLMKGLIKGNIEECSSGQDRLLEWIYTHETGRFLMKGLINPHISEIGAAFLDSRASRVLIAWFIRKNKIPMYQYEQKKYRSFNEFFKRKALPGARRIEC